MANTVDRGKVPPDIYLKCHPEQKVSIVTCILCDNVFHKSDFKRIKKTSKFITSVLVICHEHDDIDLTLIDEKQEIDNAELQNSDLKVIIAILREKLMSYKKNYNKLKLLHEGEKKKNNDTVNIQENESQKTLESLKTENKLLRELNEEIKGKNQLMQAVCDLKLNAANTSYSTITQTPKNKEKDQSVIVKPINSDLETTINNIKYNIQHKTSIPVKK